MGYKLIYWKTNKLTQLSLLCAGLFLFSCQREDIPHYNQGTPVTFTLTMEPITRVENNVWTGTETVGIYSMPDGGILPVDATFCTYKPSGSGTRVQLNPTTEDQTIYYPADGTAVNFIAYAPYTEVPYSTQSGNVVTYNLMDQTTKEKMEKVDLIYHKGNTAYSESNPVATLRFEHKLSRIVINITRGANFAHDLTGISGFGIINAPTTAACDLTTGTLIASLAGTTAPYKVTDQTEQAVYQAVLPAHTSSSYSNRTISFTLGGQMYTYLLEQDFEAGNSYTYNFILTPQGLILAGSTVLPWGTGTIAWNGDYYLGVSENTVSLYKEATTNNTLTITTNHNSIPIVNKSSKAITMDDNCDWITLGNITGSSSPYTFTYSVTENTTGSIREGYLHVTVGSMTAVVKVEQSFANTPIAILDGNTNCFIVAPGNTIRFPLSRPIALGKASSNATFTIEKLWDDTAGGAVADVSISGTGSDAYVEVTAGAAPGNALIAAKVDGTIVWSYHIWVTEYNPWQGATYTNTYNTNNNGKHFVFMDRNLGATFAGTGSGKGTGLFYQWGRKDPFPATGKAGDIQEGGGTFTAEPTSETVGTVANTVKNPNVYITTSVEPNDWLYNARDHELWGHSGSKTIYDPCPVGWRVPVSSEMTVESSPWYGFTDGNFNNGYNWGINAIYPASGMRHLQSEIAGMNNYCCCWMASPYRFDYFFSLDMYSYSTAVHVHHASRRTMGFPIRCVLDN